MDLDRLSSFQLITIFLLHRPTYANQVFLCEKDITTNKFRLLPAYPDL